MNGYQHLANAIILTAYSDYRTVLKDLKKYPRNEDRLQEIKILERLFCSGVACQAKRKKVTRKTQKTALIHPIYGNQSGFSYVI